MDVLKFSDVLFFCFNFMLEELLRQERSDILVCRKCNCLFPNLSLSNFQIYYHGEAVK